MAVPFCLGAGEAGCLCRAALVARWYQRRGFAAASPAVVPGGGLEGAGQRPIVNVSWTTFEIGFSWPVTIPGAVPLTR